MNSRSSTSKWSTYIERVARRVDNTIAFEIDMAALRTRDEGEFVLARLKLRVVPFVDDLSIVMATHIARRRFQFQERAFPLDGFGFGLGSHCDSL